MTIDWTIPCETTEDPPRPVRVLYLDREMIRFSYPIVAWVDGENSPSVFTTDGYEWTVGKGLTLRNVAPKAREDDELVRKIADCLSDKQLSYWSWEERARAVLKILEGEDQ